MRRTFPGRRYEADGSARGAVAAPPPAPARLRWELGAPLLAAVERSHSVAQALLRDVDLRILMFAHYGKGFMKACRVSPDAYIQMALQLAYFRDAGRFCLTYEASMTRLFREGRTETVRSCTLESSAWVRSMLDETASVRMCAVESCNFISKHILHISIELKFCIHI